jgi:hypothetical protein
VDIGEQGETKRTGGRSSMSWYIHPDSTYDLMQRYARLPIYSRTACHLIRLSRRPPRDTALLLAGGVGKRSIENPRKSSQIPGDPRRSWAIPAASLVDGCPAERCSAGYCSEGRDASACIVVGQSWRAAVGTASVQHQQNVVATAMTAGGENLGKKEDEEEEEEEEGGRE